MSEWQDLSFLSYILINWEKVNRGVFFEKTAVTLIFDDKDVGWNQALKGDAWSRKRMPTCVCLTYSLIWLLPPATHYQEPLTFPPTQYCFAVGEAGGSQRCRYLCSCTCFCQSLSGWKNFSFIYKYLSCHPKWSMIEIGWTFKLENILGSVPLFSYCLWLRQ